MAIDWTELLLKSLVRGGLPAFAIVLLFHTILFVAQKLPLGKLSAKQVERTIRNALIVGLLAFLFSGAGYYWLENQKLVHVPAASSSPELRAKRQFCITGASVRNLVPDIVSRTDFEYVGCAPGVTEIKLTHSGEIRSASISGYSLYDGGCVVILIDGSLCSSFPSMKLMAWPHNPGNPTALLKSNIEDTVEAMVLRNEALVLDSIVNCLEKTVR